MSLYDDLKAAARDAVEDALASVASLSGITVVVALRKKLHFDRDRDTLPFVCLWGEGEESKTLAFGGFAYLAFPVNVAFMQAGKSTLSDPVAMARETDVRNAIRDVLFKRTLGSLPLAGCTYDGGPAYDDNDLSRHYDLSVQRFVYRASGPKGS